METYFYSRIFFVLLIFSFFMHSANAQFYCGDDCADFDLDVVLKNTDGTPVTHLNQVQVGHTYYLDITDNLWVSGNGNVIICIVGAFGFDVSGTVAECENGNSCFDMTDGRTLYITANSSSAFGMMVSLRRACSPEPYTQDTRTQGFILP